MKRVFIKLGGKTRYACWPAWASRVLVLVIAILVALPAMPHASLYIPGERGWGEAAQKTSDATLYIQIVADIESGRGYYEAVAGEHRLHGYPTFPPTVFREPALAFMLVAAHFQIVRLVILFGLVGAIILVFFRELLTTGIAFPVRVTAVATVTTGLSIAGIIDAVYWHEVWAALLIAVSLLSYRPTSWHLAVLFGFLACIIRELAVPYMFVMAGFACYEKRWNQFYAWAAATILFVAIFFAHIHLASDLHRPGDFVSRSWMAFGGWEFAIATAKWNVFLHLLPYPLIALALCLGIIGLAGARDCRARRAAVVVAGYVAAFLVVGRPDNYYWGVLYAPLLPVGWLWAPLAISDLFRSAFLSVPVGAIEDLSPPSVGSDRQHHQ